MTTTRTATVVNGTLQLDEPLELPEQSRVTVSVASPTTSPHDAPSSPQRQSLDEFFQFVDQLGIRAGEHLTRDQMHERG